MPDSNFYSVTVDKKTCKVKVLARDKDAKQALWGWGSDARPSIEFYGRGTGRGAGDGEVWQWELSPDAVSELRQNLAAQIREPKYYRVTSRENKAAKQLLKKLQKAASCPRSR